ncbi:hypothetical protein BSKO_03527 [Bryopsis sp. KO-2023]|nr:hypothetical protein BSKO_03527 [Bryopsis sp. KO-2023]
MSGLVADPAGILSGMSPTAFVDEAELHSVTELFNRRPMRHRAPPMGMPYLTSGPQGHIQGPPEHQPLAAFLQQPGMVGAPPHPGLRQGNHFQYGPAATAEAFEERPPLDMNAVLRQQQAQGPTLLNSHLCMPDATQSRMALGATATGLQSHPICADGMPGPSSSVAPVSEFPMPAPPQPMAQPLNSKEVSGPGCSTATVVENKTASGGKSGSRARSSKARSKAEAEAEEARHVAALSASLGSEIEKNNGRLAAALSFRQSMGQSIAETTDVHQKLLAASQQYSQAGNGDIQAVEAGNGCEQGAMWAPQKSNRSIDFSVGNLILAAPSVVPRQAYTNGAGNGGVRDPGARGLSSNGEPVGPSGGGASEGGNVGQDAVTLRRSTVPDSKTYAALSAALDTLTASLNEDGTLPYSTFEKIVHELSGIECLQSMLLFRPNKKKGKGGRQPAKDPRLDPNICPRKAKRIVANRQSAARSKQKQKQHLENLQLQHDTLTIQTLLCRREKEKLEKENGNLAKDIKILELELQALSDHMGRVDSFINFLVQERDRLRVQMQILQIQMRPQP